MKKFIIRDWANAPVETNVDLDAMDDIRKMTIVIMTGDEILTVEYMNGHTETIDSSDCRLCGFFDGSYDIFDRETGYSCLTEEYLQCCDSYDRQRMVIGQAAADTLLIASMLGETPNGPGL